MSGSDKRDEIESFMRGIVDAVAAAERAGMTTPELIAHHLNARGITTRKGRHWNAGTVAKFQGSPGARRFRDARKAH